MKKMRKTPRRGRFFAYKIATVKQYNRRTAAFATIVNDGVAAFYRREQARMLFAIGGELSRAAETAITENFAAVKRVDI